MLFVRSEFMLEARVAFQWEDSTTQKYILTSAHAGRLESSVAAKAF